MEVIENRSVMNLGAPFRRKGRTHSSFPTPSGHLIPPSPSPTPPPTPLLACAGLDWTTRGTCAAAWARGATSPRGGRGCRKEESIPWPPEAATRAWTWVSAGAGPYRPHGHRAGGRWPPHAGAVGSAAPAADSLVELLCAVASSSLERTAEAAVSVGISVSRPKLRVRQLRHSNVWGALNWNE
jgi:hypothetical protein